MYEAERGRRWSAKRGQGSLCSARGNIVIKICTSTLHFPRAIPPTCNPPRGQCRAVIYAPQDAALSVSTASKLHPIIENAVVPFFRCAESCELLCYYGIPDSAGVPSRVAWREPRSRLAGERLENRGGRREGGFGAFAATTGFGSINAPRQRFGSKFGLITSNGYRTNISAFTRAVGFV